MKRAVLCLWLAIHIFGLVHKSEGQTATGTPQFASFGGGPFDVIDLGNLNVHFNVPIFSKAGRGFPLTYALSYDSSIWNAVQSGSTTTWTPVNSSLWGWRGVGEALGGYVSYTKRIGTCADKTSGTFYTGWNYHDNFGTTHSFPISVTTCIDGTNELSELATDGSGLTMDAKALPLSAKMFSASGLTISAPLLDPNGSGKITDRNGNFVSWTTSSGTTTFTDAFGTTALTVTGAGTVSSPRQYTYTSPSGVNGAVTVNYVQYTVATNFALGTVTEFGKQSIALVDNVTLPDNTKYKFTYEATPSTPAAGACAPLANTFSANCVTARIASITLPTGGQIAYTYTGGTGGANGVLTTDGSTSGFTRTLTPGGITKYVRAITASGLPFTTTTFTDPASHQTTMNFDGIYETSRNVAGLITTNTCYNGTLLSSCSQGVPSLPITKRTVVTTIGSQTSSQVTLYNNSGLPTETDTYNYGAFTSSSSIGTSGSLAQKTLITYTSFTPNNLGNTITNKPASIVVQDGSGNLKAKTTYAYDEFSPLQASSATNLTSITGSRGNLTTVTIYPTSTATLVRHFEYFDDGNLYQSQDVNSSTWDTTYTYAACGNSLLTSVSYRLGLTESFAWNCTGGVQTSVKDENQQQVVTNYTDPNFWRPASVQDQAGNTTTFIYTSPTQTESRLDFNSGSSTQDIVAVIDGMGRSVYSQQKQSPSSSNYDSVQFTYDPTTLTNKASVPYVGTLQQSAPSGTATGNTTYDAAGRVSQVVDGGGGSVAYSYSNNDVVNTLTPIPSNETVAKKKQLEYDSLGRLISVCELTSGTSQWPSASCQQNTAVTGYLTKYAYDLSPNFNSLAVTQNAQSGTTQTRQYIYDMLGRLTSETNPESGTTTYTYDSVAANYCASTVAYSSAGDLVAMAKADGTHVCYYYDVLHRVTAIGNNKQSSTNVCRRFAYDNSTVNGSLPSGVLISNGLGRLVEAETDDCTGSPPRTPITDEFFSYSARGELADVWESTAHSSGTYHVNATYWANGALNVLNGGTSPLPGLPKLTYSPEGEGRISSVSASSGQNPVSSTVYDLANHKTTVNFGSLDSDVFTYDPNTGRMTQYKYNVGSQSVTGNVSWNANGSLGSLSITDQLNSANSQTCTFSHDDLSRIASANCASVWQQTFGFDPFGNISKSGSGSFLPTYNTSTNRFSSMPGGTPTYDANGNLTNDLSHTYSWDTDGNAISIDSVNLTYDALDRVVEQARGSSFTQIVYSPLGSKLALMIGQTLQKAFVALPTGATAVYTSSGLTYYRHPDWLGNSRLATTTGRAKYYDLAYAPYGESYAPSGTTPDLNFTGQNQDTVLGLYDFLYREYHPAQGRWISPDPAGLGAADATNPQSWNRYTYVSNNPLAMIDPLGLEPTEGCPPSLADCGGGGNFGYGNDPNTPGGSILLDGVAVNAATARAAIGSGLGIAVILPDGCLGSVCEANEVFVHISALTNGQFGGCGQAGWLFFCIRFAPLPASLNSANTSGFYYNLQTYYLQAKTFASGELGNLIGQFKEGGCFNEFAQEAFDPGGLPGNTKEDAIKATGQTAGYVRATMYAASKGLTVPMRSSIVRGMLEFGRTAGEVAAIGLQDIEETDAFAKEMISWSKGECQ